MNIRNTIKRLQALVLAMGLLCVTGCGAKGIGQEQKPQKNYDLSHEGYTLYQVMILSRHNIRSPLSEKGSVLDTMTPHEWFNWTSDASDLSIRGGVLETEMGQYFRRWLEQEGLFPEDYQPGKELRIYCNSKQRTIATSNFFKAGLLPVGDADIEYHAEFDTMDPVFEPALTSLSPENKQEIEAQIRDTFENTIAGLADNYQVLSDVIDVKQSRDYKDGKFTGFQTDDTEFILEEGKEPGMKGSLKTANTLSDALMLQYYEADESKAAFGKTMTPQKWDSIAEIKETYGDVLFTAPMVCVNVAHPLLQEILSELTEEGRKFTFLCGHDSNIGSVLASIGAEDYSLPGGLEKKTPIGGKLVFSRWRGRDGKEYISLDMVYQKSEQLRGLELLDVDNPPGVMQLRLEGLQANSDGLYEATLVEGRIEEAIEKYDEYYN
ncbi:MAG: histidine-type phosphatase [Lachnospiraceae bacterium]|nr:histidine-type phosphatase [Lachnospiraceae bacterium]